VIEVSESQTSGRIGCPTVCDQLFHVRSLVSTYPAAFLGRRRHVGRTPAPGRGSTGAHESAFWENQAQLLGPSPTSIPTLHVVDDTFSRREETMAAIIAVVTLRAELT
jgi:hypothetical protein